MSKIIQSNECSVCGEHYDGDRLPAFLPCGHIICLLCTTRLQPLQCPVDRKPFTKEDVKRVFNGAEEKTAKQKVAEFANSVTEQIEKLEQANKKLTEALSELLNEHDHEIRKSEAKNALIASMRRLLKWYIDQHDSFRRERQEFEKRKFDHGILLKSKSFS